MLAVVGSMCGRDKDASDSNATASTAASDAAPVASTPASGASPVLESLYVGTASLNQRSAPDGSVVGRVAGGVPVDVYERKDGWARISPDGAAPRWVASRLLCAGAYCYNASPARSPVNTAPRRSRSYYQDSNCPCSGNTVCIGPRGGRYCITSGGNKRYGV